MKQELSDAFLNQPQAQPLTLGQRAVMLVIVLCCSLLFGWMILTMIGGKHYILLGVAALPLFLLFSACGRLLKRPYWEFLPPNNPAHSR
jgi:hypothetical protein